MGTFHLYTDRRGRKEPGIYEDAEGRKYLRIKEAGRKFYSYISLKTKSLEAAKEARDARQAARVASKLGLAVQNPDRAAKEARATVPAVIARYVKDGYPDKKGVPRAGKRHWKAEEGYCKTLLSYAWGKPAPDLAQHDLDEYHAWRVAQVAAGNRARDGHRTTDLELNTLNNAMRWAVRKEMFKHNPIAARARYHTAKDATHCREYSFASADGLHAAAGALMSSRRSEVFGWQLLFEGLSGLRTEEVLRLRLDAKHDEPGFVEGDFLHVRRAMKASKDNPCVLINDGLKETMRAHRIWHAARYPQSPWFFPGRDRKAGKPVDKGILTKALDRLHRSGKLKEKHTSHGARAFYIKVRRSQRASDTRIAFEINHTGGVGTIEQVYGTAPEGWRSGKNTPMSWIPTGAPAWSKTKGVNFSKTQAPVVPSFDI